MPDEPASPPRRRRRWRRWLLLVALAVGAFVGGANVYLVATTRAAIAAGAAAAPARPYAIVLGNRVYPGDIAGWEVGERLEAALAIYREGKAGKIVVSGAARGDYDEPRTMAAYLRARGVPAENIIPDPGGHRTLTTMADAAALGIRSALVVSQAYHLPRALYLARHAGIDAVGVPAQDRHHGLSLLRVAIRERLARAETLVEVALRGVHQ